MTCRMWSVNKQFCCAVADKQLHSLVGEHLKTFPSQKLMLDRYLTRQRPQWNSIILSSSWALVFTMITTLHGKKLNLFFKCFCFLNLQRPEIMFINLVQGGLDSFGLSGLRPEKAWTWPGNQSRWQVRQFQHILLLGKQDVMWTRSPPIKFNSTPLETFACISVVWSYLCKFCFA